MRVAAMYLVRSVIRKGVKTVVKMKKSVMRMVFEMKFSLMAQLQKILRIAMKKSWRPRRLAQINPRHPISKFQLIIPRKTLMYLPKA